MGSTVHMTTDDSSGYGMITQVENEVEPVAIDHDAEHPYERSAPGRRIVTLTIRMERPE